MCFGSHCDADKDLGSVSSNVVFFGGRGGSPREAYRINTELTYRLQFNVLPRKNNMMSARSFEYTPPPSSRPTASRSRRLNIYPTSNFLDLALHFIDRGV